MKNNIVFYILLAFISFIFACKKETTKLQQPSSISGLTVEPRIGAALIKWQLPPDSNFNYVEINYLKTGSKSPDKAYRILVSKYADSVLVEGLLNKFEYTFTLRTVNKSPQNESASQEIVSNAIRPIGRSNEITYFPNDLTKINVIDSMIKTYTQETSEGPKSALTDGNIDTYWHSAWSDDVQPLPHWVMVSFTDTTSLGAIKYYFRQNPGTELRPTQFGLETSEDGITWNRVWTSADNLPVTNTTAENTLTFDKNYNSKYFKIMILKNSGNVSFVALGEMSFYNMKSEVVDKELEAEQNY